ncbi:uncharacterized protein LOC144100904 [Amblyomma americanum]
MCAAFRARIPNQPQALLSFAESQSCVHMCRRPPEEVQKDPRDEIPLSSARASGNETGGCCRRPTSILTRLVETQQPLHWMSHENLPCSMPTCISRSLATLSWMPSDFGYSHRIRGRK